MNKFIVVRYESGRDALLASLRSHFLDELPFHAQKVCVYDFPKSRTLLASAEPAVSGIGAMQHTFIGEERETFLTFDGVPYLERQDFEKGWAESVSDYVGARSAHESGAEIFGTYCLVGLRRNGELYAFGDFSGLTPLYYRQKSDWFAISNRQRLLQAVLDDGEFTFDMQAYSWLTGQGNIIGPKSPYSGVRLLTPGKRIECKRRRFAVSDLPTRRWFAADGVREDFSDDELDSLHDILIRQMKALGRMPIDRLVLELSGGVDSRTVLALAIASGTIEKVGRVVTSGPEGSLEIEIAGRLAKVFDLPWKPRIMSPRSVDVSNWWNYLGVHGFRFEGTVAPPDGLGPAGNDLKVGLSGSGGEIFRPHIKAHKYEEVPNLKAVQTLLENYQQKHDPLGLQKPRVTRRQHRELRKLVRAYAREGARPEDMRYLIYVDSRLPWWAGGLHGNLLERLRIYPLLNVEAARIVYSVSQRHRQMDRVNYEILRRVDRRLVEIPFAGYSWDERLAPYMRRHGLRPSRENVVSKASGSAAQRQPAVKQFVTQAWEELMARLKSDIDVPLYEILDFQAVAGLDGKRDQVVRSVVTLKQLLAAFVIKETTEGRVRREYLGPRPSSRIVRTNVPSMESLADLG